MLYRKSRKDRKRQGRRNRKSNRNRQNGGGQGSGWEPGAPLVPGIASDAQVHQRYDACLSVPRTGQITYSPTGGLPGMKGGRYTNNLTANYAGFAQIDKIACQPNPTNPLNQHGGVGLQSAQDMGVYEASTARYTHAPSQWTDSVGAPVLLNQPLDAKMWSRACTQTAGGRSGRRNGHRKNRTHKKSKGKKSRRN
jgi:hypothetical protein